MHNCSNDGVIILKLLREAYYPEAPTQCMCSCLQSTRQVKHLGCKSMPSVRTHNLLSLSLHQQRRYNAHRRSSTRACANRGGLPLQGQDDGAMWAQMSERAASPGGPWRMGGLGFGLPLSRLYARYFGRLQCLLLAQMRSTRMRLAKMRICLY